MPVRDLSALFGATIDYPGVPSKEHPGGKTYRVPSPSAEVGARLTAYAALGLKLAAGRPLTDDERASLNLDDEQEKTFYRDVLGPVYDEMLADGIEWGDLVTIARDAYLVITDNESLADITAAAQGEAMARGNRATRRAATKRTGKKTGGSSSSRASTGTRGRTRSPASTRSSTSPSAPEGTATAV